MSTAITIIVCIVLLCIIPSIGIRRPRGYRPTRHIEHPVPPCGSGSDVADAAVFPVEYTSPVLPTDLTARDTEQFQTWLKERKRSLMGQSVYPWTTSADTDGLIDTVNKNANVRLDENQHGIYYIEDFSIIVDLCVYGYICTRHRIVKDSWQTNFSLEPGETLSLPNGSTLIRCGTELTRAKNKSTNPLLNRPPDPDLDIIIKRH
jgi:hypothetical protein